MEYKEFAINIAKEAGKIIVENFGLGMEKEWKVDDSPVTVTDTRINELVIERVNEQYPDHDILAEERSDLIDHSEYVWVCDPVDGTLPFSHGIPTCVFSIALVKSGAPILGVIYDPFLQRMYVGEQGKGAELNRIPISVSSEKKFKNSILGIDGDKLAEPFGLAEVFWKKRQLKIFRFHSIAYASTFLANGEMIASIYLSIYAHDIAALKVIIEEAGGKVTDLKGDEQRYDKTINGAIMSNGLVHDEVVKIVHGHIKE